MQLFPFWDHKRLEAPKFNNHDPQVLLADYQTQQTEISVLRNQLKTILGDALVSQEPSASEASMGDK